MHCCRVGLSDAPLPTSTHLGSLCWQDEVLDTPVDTGHSGGYDGNLDDEDRAGRNSGLVHRYVAIVARLAGRWIHLVEGH